jgi:hypothetical protein
MKIRPWITLGGGVLLAGSCYAVLMPDERDAFRDRLPWAESYPEVREAQAALNASLVAEARAELAWEIGHSLAAAEALPRARAPFTVTAERGIPAATVARIESQARAELSALGRPPVVPIVLRIVVDSVRTRVGYRRVVVAPTAATDPCVIVYRIGAVYVGRATGFSTTDRILGTCGFYALYGMPGTGMQAWLARTGARSAASVHYAPEDVGRQGPLEMDVAMMLMSPTPAACVARRDVACRRVYDAVYDDGPRGIGNWERDVVAESRAANPRTWTFYPWHATWVGGMQLAGVRDHLGDERFAPIWRSAAEPSEAYLNSEGRPLEAWVRENISRTIQPYFPGPMVRVIPLLLTLLLTGAFAWWGIRRTARAMS